ncbi:MAG: YdcF family protein [Lachnospiraceae bacterium]|nr:YdcF family protein [Lachnospiraceae bacterium]
MTKFLQDITEFIFLQDKPKKADVIFIPGSNEGDLARRAAELYHEGYAPLIVPSGKYAKWIGHNLVKEYETESDYFEAILLHEGVPKEAVLKEREATYTYENAIFTKKLLEKRGIEVKTAILCPQAYHARRSKLYYQVLFPDTEILVCPTVTKGISRENWFKSPEKIDKVLSELERCGSQFHEIVEQYGRMET